MWVDAIDDWLNSLMLRRRLLFCNTTDNRLFKPHVFGDSACIVLLDGGDFTKDSRMEQETRVSLSLLVFGS